MAYPMMSLVSRMEIRTNMWAKLRSKSELMVLLPLIIGVRSFISRGGQRRTELGGGGGGGRKLSVQSNIYACMTPKSHSFRTKFVLPTALYTGVRFRGEGGGGGGDRLSDRQEIFPPPPPPPPSAVGSPIGVWGGAPAALQLTQFLSHNT